MTYHMNRTGHQKLSDGSVLRLDVELGAYVASWYRPDLSLQACAYGSLEDMRSLVGDWADAYEASLSSAAVGVAGSGAVLGDQPPVQPPNTLGETA